MRGTFTTTFGWIFASSRPSATMPSASVAITSAEMGPSTISQISRMTTRVGLPAFARSDGFVVTPSTTDIGDTGKELGFGPDANYGNRITNGVAVKFDFKDNLGEGANTIAIVAKGRSMTGPGTNLTSKSLNFTSGHVFRVRIVNSGTSLSVSIRDKSTLAGSRLVANYNLYSIAAAADGTAYVGFTSATGSLGGQTKILSWSYGAGN